jgi:hypothetical protein
LPERLNQTNQQLASRPGQQQRAPAGMPCQGNYLEEGFFYLPRPVRGEEEEEKMLKSFFFLWRQGFLLEFLNFGQWVHEHAQII